MEIEKYKTIFDYCRKIFANIKKFLKKYHKLIKINKSSQTDQQIWFYPYWMRIKPYFNC